MVSVSKKKSQAGKATAVMNTFCSYIEPAFLAPTPQLIFQFQGI